MIVNILKPMIFIGKIPSELNFPAADFVEANPWEEVEVSFGNINANMAKVKFADKIKPIHCLIQKFPTNDYYWILDESGDQHNFGVYIRIPPLKETYLPLYCPFYCGQQKLRMTINERKYILRSDDCEYPVDYTDLSIGTYIFSK